MVVRNKFYRIVDKYRSLLKRRQEKNGNKGTARGVKTKNKILDFYLKNDRWPSRKSKSSYERKLGARFENFLSKESKSYDSHFRRLALATGRKINNKRKHNVEAFKEDILKFIKEHGRVPAGANTPQNVEGEGLLRSRLEYYTQKCNDMTLLGKIYKVDKCHRSGIPSKYRKILNSQLDLEKPLIRLV